MPSTKRDSEIVIIEKVCNLLSPLDEAAKERVLDYVCDRHYPNPPCLPDPVAASRVVRSQEGA